MKEERTTSAAHQGWWVQPGSRSRYSEKKVWVGVEAGTAAEWSGQVKMAAGRRSSEPVNLSVLSPGPLLAAARVVRLKSGVRRWGLEPVLGKSDPGCYMSVLGAAVGIRAGEVHDLESARG
jgi:hypothetical protein